MNEVNSTDREKFDPRILRLTSRYDGEHWAVKVAKFSASGGLQPFHGTTSLAPRKGQAREHLLCALRGFTMEEAESAL